ncbi:uncharacterized protein (TIGR03085 family) [Sediminihabitans luteus]|uniref:Uncharacterized protein (TIGR03085 family) n=1 Tax=Sediminihabitans luteus TaxID=1138585 RepID=A0A2M9CR07_9CELL|nr:TIGR03085 family metal-binding protein [Sediminihabitans luteus]PJJ74353.1 uncharacterized protein (TIGR03085 family) [Sediminihabitans luteus]GIJ00465.1 TIGR03085 family protein [Sediminihabitans luteus]
MPWHPMLRARLADTLREASPEAPTLCEGWQARHLAAHLVLREHAPWRLVGGRLASMADDARDRPAYDALVSRVAQPPSRRSPHAWAGDLMDVAEFFVHTEDVRRGAGDVAPLDLPDDVERALRGPLRVFARRAYRRSPVGVELVDPGDGARVVRPPRREAGTVQVTGATGELVLHAFGRRERAHVQVSGDPADVAAFRAAYPGS